MNENIEHLLNQLKDSVENPVVNVSNYFGEDTEVIDNECLFTSMECADLLEYITNLQKQNAELKEENERLKNNWNELKEWIKKENREDAIVINLTWKHATGKVLNKMQEIESGKNE